MNKRKLDPKYKRNKTKKQNSGTVGKTATAINVFRDLQHQQHPWY
jgi:hypothetical protein